MPSNREIENQKILKEIRRVYHSNKGIYGSPRIAMELQDNHLYVSRPRVARLMKKAGIKSIIQRKYATTTNSKHHYPIAENLLNRNFQADRIGQKWVSDITYIKTSQGWMYLTVIIDLADRKVIGWSTSSNMDTNSTVISAWKMAIMNRPIYDELIFHSDRGIQYASNEFRNIIKANKKVRQSMSRKGNCWDNAVAESFFKSLKSEWIYHHKYKTKEQARLSVFEYIETWYNTKRKHSELNYLAPIQFESSSSDNKKMIA